MHEASIVLSILDTVFEQCRREGYSTIQNIRVKIGQAAGILPDALSFAFDVAKKDTIADNAELNIELVPVGGTCHACNKDFELAEARLVFQCPSCSSDSITVNRGYEMQIVDMDVD